MKQILTVGEFMKAKEIVKTHSAMEAIAHWSYDQYCICRYMMQMRERPVVCTVDPTHTVNIYGDTRVRVTAKTGEVKVIDQLKNVDYECEDCLGRHKQFVVDEKMLNVFEDSEARDAII